MRGFSGGLVLRLLLRRPPPLRLAVLPSDRRPLDRFPDLPSDCCPLASTLVHRSHCLSVHASLTTLNEQSIDRTSFRLSIVLSFSHSLSHSVSPSLSGDRPSLLYAAFLALVQQSLRQPLSDRGPHCPAHPAP